MKSYRVFGLTIASELALPELIPCNQQAQISIRYAQLQHIQIPEPQRAKNHLIGKQQLLINLPDIARFLVSKGQEIRVDPAPGISEKELRLFLLGSGFGALLHQRGVLVLHANAIVINDDCLVFAGHSGKGKSTLAAAFVRAGYQFICDDLCAISFNQNGQALVLPGYPHIKLWESSLLHLGENPANHDPVRAHETKYRLQQQALYCQQARALKHVYALHFHSQDAIRFRQLNTLAATEALRNYTYKARMAKTMGCLSTQFQQIGQLLNSVSVSHFCRPQNLHKLDESIHAITEHHA